MSLLPGCLAARLSGTLSEVEAVVRAAEQAPSLEAFRTHRRLDIELPGALGWERNEATRWNDSIDQPASQAATGGGRSSGGGLPGVHG
nr:hypothetical protein [Thiocapsa sp. KS1]